MWKKNLEFFFSFVNFDQKTFRVTKWANKKFVKIKTKWKEFLNEKLNTWKKLKRKFLLFFSAFHSTIRSQVLYFQIDVNVIKNLRNKIKGCLADSSETKCFKLKKKTKRKIYTRIRLDLQTYMKYKFLFFSISNVFWILKVSLLTHSDFEFTRL